MIWCVVYVLWCGLCWRLRGGMISDITSRFWRPLTTGETRIACAALMALPLAAVHPVLVLAALSIWAAMTVGYFNDAMGLEKRGDVAQMSWWGVTVAAIMIVPMAVLHYDALRLLPAVAGAFVGPAYLTSKRFGGKWTERAEWVAGMLFGVAIALSAA
jgi:hypothetical protein